LALKLSRRSLNEISKDQFIRSDADFFRLTDNVQEELKSTGLKFDPIQKYITFMETGKPIARKDYATKPTGYIHVVVRNIENGKLSLGDDPIYLIEEKGKELEKHKLLEGEFVLAISSNVGDCFLYHGEHKEIQFTLSHYLVKIRFNSETFYPKFMVYWLNSSVIKEYFRACETGKTQMNLSKQYLDKLPFPKIDKGIQESIVNKMKPIEARIVEIEKSIPNTQEVIERVFQELFGYVPCEKYVKKGFSLFKQPFHKLGQRKYIRAGARYNSFWNIFKGMLFETDKPFKAVELRKLIVPYKTEIFEKGFLPKEYVLIDEEDIEQKTGVILNEEYVQKIESSKVLFADCDLLVSKIRPYLGHVILNEKEKPFIGTTELVPYKVIEDRIYPRLIQFMLLSNNFLELSKSIMSGKNQPRIQPYELLDLKVPLPPREPIDLQKEAVDRIEREIGNLKEKSIELKKTLLQRDTLFWEYLKNQHFTR
jgi:restriction endonuclease S subunit